MKKDEIIDPSDRERHEQILQNSWEVRQILKQQTDANERLMKMLENTIVHQQKSLDRLAERLDGLFDSVGTFSDAFLEFHDAFDTLLSDINPSSKCPNCGKPKSWSETISQNMEKADPDFLKDRGKGNEA